MRGESQFVNTDCYSYFSRYGEVLIAPNDEYPSKWDLWIDDQLICPAYYSSADEAAHYASRRDFGDEELNRKFVGLRVPDDLRQWRATKLRRAIIS